jgi:hypothetical protein
MPSKIEQDRIAMALEVLREAVTQARVERVDTKGVQLALRVLRRHVDDAWLKQFWSGTSISNDIGRAQNVSAALNGIERDMRGRRASE